MSTNYVLKHPITYRTRVHGQDAQEVLVAEVNIRRIKAKDLRMLDRVEGKFAQSLALVAALTGLTPNIVDEIDGEDIEAIGGMVGDFFPGRQETGEKSSAT